MINYRVRVNGVEFAPYIERDSYHTERLPVFTDSVTTSDGVEHCSLIRQKGKVTFTLNPLYGEVMLTLARALLTHPLTVEYFCQQRQVVVSARMKLPEQTADYLSRCLAGGQKWFQVGEIALEEL